MVNKRKQTLTFFFFFTLHTLILFWDAGKNSSSGAISRNTGERSDPCREKAEDGIHSKVSQRFKEKCYLPPLKWATTHFYPFPSLPALPCTPTRTSPAYYLRFVKIHFTLTGIFQPSKTVLICLTSQSSSNSVKSAKPARPPLSLFSFFLSPSHSKHASSCTIEDLS